MADVRDSELRQAVLERWSALAGQSARQRRIDHERRVDLLLADHLRRRRDQQAHPVEDFLFTYYSHRPAGLRRWFPGLTSAWAPDGGELDAVTAFAARRTPLIMWVRDLLRATSDRPASYSCFGLHEWAMLFRTAERRHGSWPLRLPAAEIDRLVAERGVRCTHYDAFRFFTPLAVPLNAVQLTRSDQPAYEQKGCLHATMDLYKWSYRVVPLPPAELVADCFELARDARALDMRASPYDLRALGYRPVTVETAEGRAEYAVAQRGIAERAAPLRAALIDVLDQALELP